MADVDFRILALGVLVPLILLEMTVLLYADRTGRQQLFRVSQKALYLTLGCLSALIALG